MTNETTDAPEQTSKPAEGKSELNDGLCHALWCVHFIGPDDLFAAPSKEEAEERVAAYNEWIERTPMMRYCGMKAEVQMWPWTPEGHAESLTQWGELFPEGHNA